MRMKSLQGLKAIVTGGGRGIGEATCRALAAEGAAVTVLDLDRDVAESVAQSLPGASAAVVDITSEAAASVPKYAPLPRPRARKKGVLSGPVVATMPLK